LSGAKDESVSWLFMKKPPTMCPLPKMLSTVVVIDSALPSASTITMWLVPPGSSVWSGPTLGLRRGCHR
jgi:hypothetical protein